MTYCVDLVGSVALNAGLMYATRVVADACAPAWCGRHLLDARGREDWDSRVVSTINAVYVAAGYYAFASRAERGLGSSYEATLAGSCGRDRWMVALCGYLVVDSALCCAAVWRRRRRRRRGDAPAASGSFDDPLVLAHHVVVLVAFGVGMRTRLATRYMASLLFNEASTPFLNLRSLINYASPPRADGARESALAARLYAANGACLVVVYGACRVAWTLFVVAHIARSWRDLWRVGVLVGDLRVGVVVCLSGLCGAHLGLNLYWYGLICAKARRALLATKRA